MPVYRRRKYARKSKPRLAYKKMQRRRAAARGGHGKAYVVRKCPMISLSNIAGTAGGMQVTDPTGTMLSIATPVAKSGFTQVYDVPFSLSFRLSQMTNVVDLTAISDRYKINSVKVEVESPYTTAQAPGGAATPVPYIEYDIDFDDDTVPNVSTFRERMGIKTKYFSSSRPKVAMVCRPRPRNTIAGAVAAVAYSVPARAPFINSAYDQVPHFGIKGVLRNVWIPAVVNGSPFTFDATIAATIADFQ